MLLLSVGSAAEHTDIDWICNAPRRLLANPIDVDFTRVHIQSDVVLSIGPPLRRRLNHPVVKYGDLLEQVLDQWRPPGPCLLPQISEEFAGSGIGRHLERSVPIEAGQCPVHYVLAKIVLQ